MLQNIDLQVLDWRATDIVVTSNKSLDSDDDSDDDNNDKQFDFKNSRSYIIKAFGIDEQGSSVSVTITDFQPYFFIRPKKQQVSSVIMKKLQKHITSSLSQFLLEDFIGLNVVSKKEMWGFTNNQYFDFIQIQCKSMMCMKSCAKIVKTTSFCKFNIYESNIEPFIRFLHHKNINPSGWIRLPKNKCSNNINILRTSCVKDILIQWKHVESLAHKEYIAPLKIASFDIECTSSHGDFPLAIKCYEKVTSEFIQYFQKISNETNMTPSRIIDKIYNALLFLFCDQDIHEYKEHFSNIIFKKNNSPVDNNMLRVHAEDLFNILNNKVKLKTNLSTRYSENSSYDPIDVFKNRFNQYNTNKNDDDETIQDSVFVQLNTFLTKYFPDVEGDEVIQISTTFHHYGKTDCYYKHVITLDTCDDIEGINKIVRCKTERDVLLEWTTLIQNHDPDIITGYNIIGFDMKYIYERAQELRCVNDFSKLGRYKNKKCELQTKTLSSSALGDNFMYVIDMEGRVVVDLMKVVQRDHNLDSYKLDNVATHFIQGKVTKIIDSNTLELDSIGGIYPNSYIKLKSKEDSINDKYYVQEIVYDKKQIKVIKPFSQEQLQKDPPITWGLAKDDVTPNEIFQCQKGTSADRAKIAKYCAQDSALCNLIIIKLEIVANNIGMSNVCCVPLSYIFMRGQGVKIFSLVSKQCREDNIIIPVLNKPLEECMNDDGYEGAIVLTPDPGVYINEPISVMDYASLYPSSMISENISHDSIVLDEKYNNLNGIEYVDIIYDVFEGIGDKKNKISEKTCRFAQFKNNEKGILPRILQKLLKQRKATRKRITEKKITTIDNDTYIGFELPAEEENTFELLCNGENLVFDKDDIIRIEDAHNDFTKAVLDGLQLAYKVTANSLYGQVGARTSPIYMKELAASTTATGRNLILTAKKFMEDNYDTKVIYGDTDSIFVNFRLNEKEGLTGQEALKKSIELSVKASKEFKKAHLKAPHELEYEKTFYPFIILSKKKYVGNLYEFDVTKFKQKSMGIVLKRRDNANIVKIIYGGIIDIILNERNVQKAIDFINRSLKQLVNGQFPLENLVITKTLKAIYKDPTKIAHKVLADRMGERDPGSKPQVNDRIPFVYITTKEKNALQGNRIEHPSYIIDKKLEPDYKFYISNQLMKPISQLLALVLEDIKGYRYKNDTEFFKRKEKTLMTDKKGNVKKVQEKINTLRMIEVENILFQPILKKLEAKNQNNQFITNWFH